jgi:hypothetical protein
VPEWMLVKVPECSDGVGNERREKLTINGANGAGGGRQASSLDAFA